jgi:hypothetical protein
VQTFVQKQSQPQATKSSGANRTEQVQAEQRVLQTHAEVANAGMKAVGSSRGGHDFGRIPIHPPAAGAVRTKLAINQPGDEYEQEADRVSEQVMQMSEPQIRSVHDQRLQLKPAGESGLGQAGVPSVVHEVLRSPGQQLDATTRAFMEPRFGHDFSRIRIHSDSPAATAAAALGAQAFTVGHHIAFARERFVPGTAASRRLMAHELTHTIQQAAITPYIALKPEKKTAPPLASSDFTGALLGTDRNNKQILVKREVGGTKGYDDRLQAIAIARLAKAEPAAVALGKDGKWHAFETTTGINVEDASANDPRASKLAAVIPFKEIHILPSATGIDQLRQRVDELKAKSSRLDDLAAEWKNDPAFRDAVKGSDKPFLEAVDEEKELTGKRLQQANATRAASIFGVPEAEISFNEFSSQRKANMINLTANPGPGANSDARHGPVIGQGGTTDFAPGMITAFDIDTKDLDTPARAQGAMFHEVSHLKDFELAQQWVGIYQTETGRMFVGGPGIKFFMDWIQAQARKKPPRLSQADAELIVDEAVNVSATTEARANIRTFLAHFQTGVPDEATRALTNYAAALPPGTAYGAPPRDSAVLAELTKELKTAYRQATKLQKSQFEAAIAAAKTANPSAWVSQIDFAK